MPFLLALRGATPRSALWLGLVWGTIEHWSSAYWVLPAISNYYGQPFWFALLFGVVTSLLYRGAFYSLLALVISSGARHLSSIGRVAFTAAAWVAIELLRARGPSEDPWLLIGYALGPYDNLAQIASLGGVHALSFLVVFANAALAEVLATTRERSYSRALAAAAAGAAAIALAATYGSMRLQDSISTAPQLQVANVPGANVQVAIVQGNNDFGAQWSPGYYGRGLDEYLALSRRALEQGPVDLLVWPESALTFFVAREQALQEQIRQLLRESETDLVVGAPHFAGSDPALPEFLNSAFYMDAERGIADRYDKNTLLPFAEYYPLRMVELLRREFAPVRSFTPGSEALPLRTRVGPIAVAICFEAVHPDQVRRRMAQGAVALFNLSNDGWLGHGAGPAQHFAMARMRAIENDTWMVRSTTTGITAVVDPRGHIVAEIPADRATYLRAAFSARPSTTLYQRWGDWVGFACLAGVAAVPSALLLARAMASWKR